MRWVSQGLKPSYELAITPQYGAAFLAVTRSSELREKAVLPSVSSLRKQGSITTGYYRCAKLAPRRAQTTTAGGYGSRVALSLARDDIEVFGFRQSR
jgi:hypothetical protein